MFLVARCDDVFVPVVFSCLMFYFVYCVLVYGIMDFQQRFPLDEISVGGAGDFAINY